MTDPGSLRRWNPFRPLDLLADTGVAAAYQTMFRGSAGSWRRADITTSISKRTRLEDITGQLSAVGRPLSVIWPSAVDTRR